MTFQSYCRAVAKKWNDSVYRNVSECMGYTGAITTFRFNVRIIDRNVKSEMPHDFAMYERVFKLVVRKTDLMQALHVVLCFKTSHRVSFGGHNWLIGRFWLRQRFISSACQCPGLALRRHSEAQGHINRKERVRINEENLEKYMRVYYNKIT